jgi:hypothetical protein
MFVEYSECHLLHVTFQVPRTLSLRWSLEFWKIYALLLYDIWIFCICMHACLHSCKFVFLFLLVSEQLCISTFISFLVLLKLSRNKSWRLRGETECWAFILTLTFGRFFVSVTSWLDPTDGECKQKDEVTWIFSKTLPGIESATSSLVAQCLNQLHHRWPCS